MSRTVSTTGTSKNSAHAKALLAGASSVLALGALGATAGPTSAAPSGAQVNGQATWYNTGLGACGWSSNDSQLVVAVSQAVYGNQPNPNNSPVCGKQLRVNGPLGSVTVTVVDKCWGCATNDIDLSPAAFRAIGDPNVGRVTVSWNWV